MEAPESGRTHSFVREEAVTEPSRNRMRSRHDSDSSGIAPTSLCRLYIRMQMSTGCGTGKGTSSSEFHPPRVVSDIVTDFPIQEATPSERLQ